MNENDSILEKNERNELMFESYFNKLESLSQGFPSDSLEGGSDMMFLETSLSIIRRDYNINPDQAKKEIEQLIEKAGVLEKKTKEYFEEKGIPDALTHRLNNFKEDLKKIIEGN